MIICDEPVSALDVSVQAQVLNLLEDLKARHGLTLIFIAHDLAVVKNISDRAVVMYLGKLCEVAPSDELYAAPMHPYTNVLLASIPVPDPEAEAARSTSSASRPRRSRSGCRFHPLSGPPRCAPRPSLSSKSCGRATSSPATTPCSSHLSRHPRRRRAERHEPVDELTELVVSVTIDPICPIATDSSRGTVAP